MLIDDSIISLAHFFLENGVLYSLLYIFSGNKNALWYVTNQHTVIRDAAMKDSTIKCIPSTWCDFQGFNDCKRKKVKEMPMTREILITHAEALLSLMTRPSLSPERMNGLKQEILGLQECFRTYAEYLRKKNITMQLNKSLNHPVRQVENDISVQIYLGSDSVIEKYRTLDNTMKMTGNWQPVLFDENTHVNEPFSDNLQRFRFFQTLQLSIKIGVLRYCPGGSKKTLVYIWKIPDCSEAESATQTARIIAALKPKLPEYHTRAMKKQWKQRFKSLVPFDINTNCDYSGQFLVSVHVKQKMQGE